MGILRESPNCFPGGIWSSSAAAVGMVKPCEYCHLAAALVFCRTDNTFVCLSCDARLHAHHERVWVCEVCEQAAASVTCRADAAALCIACDRDIHSANPLALRHERVPVVPFYDPVESVVKSTAASLLVSINGSNDMPTSTTTTTTATTGIIVPTCIEHHEEDYSTNPWIPPNTITSKLPLNNEMKSMDFIFQDSENFLDFHYSLSIDAQSQPQYNSANDSVVPVQTTIKPIPFHHQEKHFEIDFSQSHIKSYNTPSLSHSVSSSSSDVGIVPDGSSISEISYPFIRNVNDLANSANQGEKLMGLDREARVLRYKEKKKNRKFEKTIRYASRKAYAETRPRIKGRFTKRTEGVDSDVDQIFPEIDFIANDLHTATFLRF